MSITGDGTIVLIGDPRVIAIPVEENGETMVDLRRLGDRIVIDETRSEIANESCYFCFARETVAALLTTALSNLPDQFRLVIKEAYRPSSQQARSFEKAVGATMKLNSAHSRREAEMAASQYVAPLSTAPHPTGAALDLTISDQDMIDLDMGTEFNAEPWDTDNRTYFDSELITAVQRTNRMLLKTCMESAGFVNYPSEWWHWSYGDKYWAMVHGTRAKYGVIEESDIAAWISH